MPYIGQQPTNVAFLTDTFSGNGSTTAFTLSAAPANTSSVLVAVSGVLQDPSTYSVSGTTLTFSGAPPTGTSNISVRFLGIPASGVTTTAYRTVTEFTATAGQTTFSVPSYTVGFIDVYRNGVMLGSADYTATNGTTVVLVAGATAGDLVEVISFQVSSVLNAIPGTAGSVGTTYLADSSVTTAKIAAGAVIPADLSTGAPSWDGSGNLSFNSGYGSVATAYGCRAWVNFNGTGTVAIRASGNVSSITDNGTGDYTVNFTTAMTDANYCVSATTSIAFGGVSGAGVISESLSTGSSYSNKTSSAVRMITIDNNADTAYDSFSTNVAIFR
jgi:hypothetical protein